MPFVGSIGSLTLSDGDQHHQGAVATLGAVERTFLRNCTSSCRVGFSKIVALGQKELVRGAVEPLNIQRRS